MGFFQWLCGSTFFENLGHQLNNNNDSAHWSGDKHFVIGSLDRVKKGPDTCQVFCTLALKEMVVSVIIIITISSISIIIATINIIIIPVSLLTLLYPSFLPQSCKYKHPQPLLPGGCMSLGAGWSISGVWGHPAIYYLPHLTGPWKAVCICIFQNLHKSQDSQHCFPNLQELCQWGGQGSTV